MSKSYQYNADATIKSSHDLLNQHFDRAYSYDHGGRMTKALSGAEARGEGPTNDRPYYLAFSYDAFNHPVYEDGRFWTAASAPSFSYQNNRRADATYDADGNVLGDPLVGSYGYDAAGNVANSYSAGGLAVQNFDGNGRSAKSAVTSEVGDNQWETTTVYYVRSSVLNGKVLTEVTPTGTKLRTFIYLGNQLLAWQRIGINNYERLVWEHRDPSNASYRVSDETQSTAGAFDGEFAAELDPSGANAGIANPYVEPPPNPPNEALLGYPSNGNPSQPNVSFTYNGVPMSRSELMDLVGPLLHSGGLSLIEVAAKASTRALGYRNKGVSWGRPFETIYDANGRVLNMQMGDVDPSLAGVNYGVESTIYNDNWALAFSLAPQKTNTSDCGKFIDDMILRVAFSENLAGAGRGMALWARDELAPQATKGTLGFGGFKQKYTDGGQNGFALVHIAGVAGVTLVGHEPLIPVVGTETGYQRSYAQYNEDNRQLLAGLDRKARGFTTINYAGNPNYPLNRYIAEKHAEKEDDGAGSFVGHTLETGHLDWGAARLKMWQLLCDK